MMRDYPLMKSDLMAKPTDGKPRPKIQVRVYAVIEKDVEASNTVVIGTIIYFLMMLKYLLISDPHTYLCC